MDRRATCAAVGLLVFFASLPLQWQVIARTPIGIIRWFHIGALLMVVLASPTLAGLGAVVRRARPLVLSLSALTGLLLLAAVAYHTDRAQAAQHLVYALLGLCVASALVTALRDDRGRRIVAWVAPVALVSFLAFFTRTLAAAGMGPSTIASAILSSDPSAALTTFFRVAFRSVNQSEAVNTRHEMFAALLVATYVSLAAAPRHRAARIVVALTTVLVAGLTVISLSRAVTLAACVPLAIGLVHLLARRRTSAPVMVGLGLVLLSTPWVVPLLWRIFQSRFLEDTTSYEARLGALSDLTPGDVGVRLFLGGGDLPLSTHTMMFDAALRGGLLAGIAATGVVYVFARHALRALRSYLATGRVVALASVGAGALVLIRSFTGGGGLLHLVEWAAFGLVVAVEMTGLPTAQRSAAGPPALDDVPAEAAPVPAPVERLPEAEQAPAG